MSDYWTADCVGEDSAATAVDGVVISDDLVWRHSGPIPIAKDFRSNAPSPSHERFLGILKAFQRSTADDSFADSIEPTRHKLKHYNLRTKYLYSNRLEAE